MTSIIEKVGAVERPHLGRWARLTNTCRCVAVRVADRVHAAGDEEARAAGWTVARVGWAGRSYRSPLFDTRGGAS